MSQDPAVPPFGAHSPTRAQARVIGWARALDGSPLGKPVASLARRLVLPGLTGAIDVETWGLRMRLDPRRNIAEKRVLFSPARFDPAERAALAAHLRPGGVFVDVGANVGMYSLWAGRAVGTGGRVLSLEPQPSVLARLRAHAALNPDLPLAILPVAAGRREETLRLSLNAANEGEASLALPGKDGIDVAVRPLLALVTEAGLDRIDALKIDVEGFEESVLEPFFEAAPRALWPRLMVLERGEEDWAGDLLGLLRGHGYVVRLTSRMNHVLDLTG
jgi:FkbM family methyltransferase